MTATAEDFFTGIAQTLRETRVHPHGPVVEGDLRYLAGDACVKLCNGNHDTARTLWKLIIQDVGYMPEAAARTLLRAADTTNLVPDIEAPVPS